MSGYIYIIGPSEGPLKIGRSNCPERRLSLLQTGHYQRLLLIGKWHHDNAPAVELEVHRLLKPNRLGGEWFNVSKDEAAIAVLQAVAKISRSPGKQTVEVIPEVPPKREVEVVESGAIVKSYVFTPSSDPFFGDPVTQAMIAQWEMERASPAYGPQPPHRMGYIRPTTEADLDRQRSWLFSQGIHPYDMWIEGKPDNALSGAMWDMRPGDIFFLWSPDVAPSEEQFNALVTHVSEVGAIIRLRSAGVSVNTVKDHLGDRPRKAIKRAREALQKAARAEKGKL